MARSLFCILLVTALFSCSSSSQTSSGTKGWVSLFDGKTFDGWQVNENPGTFKIEDGMIVVNGPRAHLFYNGPVMNHDFKNFELKVKVMTTPGSNSGIFIHTQYQATGWPAKGFEVQVNNSHTDWRRTASLYAIQDVRDVYVKDNEWYEMLIRVVDKTVTISINNKVVNEYTEPNPPDPERVRSGKVFSGGTFALQGHDPKSKVMYKEVMVRAL